ncbi:acyl-CoA thioesterase [Aeromicrobium sp. Root236]|uniref:acyl-CoA thioesterase n=1 Tax=Aeromicrobium sp. Root236 TaxID=1736498 RepID=UPI001F2A837C|nr:acyl-CoA thioesterase [Aeromicrobium sp. Root236]
MIIDPSHEESRELTMTILMTPEMVNFAGNVRGGLILKYLDQVAYTCASRFTRPYMVTASVDQVCFRSALHNGDVVTFLASVNHTGRTSLEVGIRVEAEDVTSGARRHTNSCYFTMVAVDGGRPCAVRQVIPAAPEQLRRWADAEARRGLRRLRSRRSSDWRMPGSVPSWAAAGTPSRAAATPIFATRTQMA